MSPVRTASGSREFVKRPDCPSSDVLLAYAVRVGRRPAARGHQAAPRPLRFLRRRVALIESAPARRGRDFRPRQSTLISPTIRRADITEEGRW